MTLTLDDVLPRLKKKKERSRGKWQALCPAHDDKNPSLSVTEGEGGRVLLHCHAGCSYEAITTALGLRVNGNGYHPQAQPVPQHIVATYDYVDAAGKLLFQKVRYVPKNFKVRRPDGKGSWAWGLGDAQPVLYHLPDLTKAPPGTPIYIAEGEKDVDRLASLGLTATCNFDGAAGEGQRPKWQQAYNPYLTGRVVYVLPDNDEPGRAHAEAIAAGVHNGAQCVKIVPLPDLPHKGDVSDWLDAGHTRQELDRLCQLAPAWVTGKKDSAESPPLIVTNYQAEDVPELPEAARIDPRLGIGACPWLDDYIAFSRFWSPRAFDHFHEAVGVWVLSSVAARRVLVHLSKPRYPSLYITLTARTSMHAKSTTAEIGLQTINKAGLGWLLAADNATPQKFIKDLTPTLPEDYNQLSDDDRTIVRNRLALAGQRGWYYDEFGQHIAAMMRDGGFMADFRGLLRRFDDAPDHYEYGTVGRGTDRVTRPYLALLANMTPSDLAPFAKKGAALWGDGFLARFATITPPDGERQRARFPDGERVIPQALIKGLRDWHERLGLPQVTITDMAGEDGKPTGRKRPVVGAVNVTTLDLPPDVKEAFYAYHDGLQDITERNENYDLDGNYARLAEKALRVAILFASVNNDPALTLAHWAAAQSIAERWRAGLHELYAQVGRGISEDRENEDTVTMILGRLGGTGTANDVKRFMRSLSTGEITRILDGLCAAGVTEVVETTKKRTKRYALVGG